LVGDVKCSKQTKRVSTQLRTKGFTRGNKNKGKKTSGVPVPTRVKTTEAEPTKALKTGGEAGQGGAVPKNRMGAR